VGKLSFAEAACEMQNASYFLHASNYETFSLVCAEALSCGTPVVASAVGGVPEYLNDKNGILVSDNTVESWTNCLKHCFITQILNEI
jgi:glycosyltransferase involved in cell wall biosynthesis